MDTESIAADPEFQRLMNKYRLQKEKCTPIFEKLRQNLKYFYVRQTLATELYMVEKWEEILVLCLFVLLFICFWVFNYFFVMMAMNNVKIYMVSKEDVSAVMT